MSNQPTELLPERRHFEVNRGSNGWMVGYFEGVHFKKVAKFYQREALDRFLALPECPTCAYTVDDLARTPSPTPSSAEARELAKAILQHLTPTRLDWAQLWLSGDVGLTAGKDVFEAIEEMISATLSTPQPALQQAIECVRDYRKWYDEKMFRPVTTEETQAVHKQFDGMVDRISAAMARDVIDKLVKQLSSLSASTEETNNAK